MNNIIQHNYLHKLVPSECLLFSNCAYYFLDFKLLDKFSPKVESIGVINMSAKFKHKRLFESESDFLDSYRQLSKNVSLNHVIWVWGRENIDIFNNLCRASNLENKFNLIDLSESVIALFRLDHKPTPDETLKALGVTYSHLEYDSLGNASILRLLFKRYRLALKTLANIRLPKL